MQHDFSHNFKMNFSHNVTTNLFKLFIDNFSLLYNVLLQIELIIDDLIHTYNKICLALVNENLFR